MHPKTKQFNVTLAMRKTCGIFKPAGYSYPISIVSQGKDFTVNGGHFRYAKVSPCGDFVEIRRNRSREPYATVNTEGVGSIAFWTAIIDACEK
jgi:hypothetical protein